MRDYNIYEFSAFDTASQESVFFAICIFNNNYCCIINTGGTRRLTRKKKLIFVSVVIKKQVACIDLLFTPSMKTSTELWFIFII